MSHHISTLCGRNAVWGLPQKKIEVIPIAGDDLDFQIFGADRLAAVWMHSLSLSWRCKPRIFSFSRSLCSRVYVFYSVMRQQVPKPMFEAAIAGELFADTGNGDRYVL